MKTKRLLSFAVATTMLLSLLNIGAFANEVKTGALSIKSPDPITVGTETVDVDFTLTFDEETKSPHSLCTIVTDLELKALAVKTVDGEVPPTYNGSEGEPDDGLVTVDTVTISNDGADLANKKVVFESGVDSNAPVVTEIVFTATFNTADKAEGTYTVGATVDATNYDENDFNIPVGEDAVVTIEEAHKCDHADATAVVTTRPTKDTEGERTFTCDCGHSWSENIPVATLKTEASHGNTFRVSNNLSLNSSIEIGFRLRAAYITDAVDYYAIFNKEKYDNSGAVTGISTTYKYAEDFVSAQQGTRYDVNCDDVTAPEMSSVVYADIYRELSDGTWEYVTGQYSIAQYANDAFGTGAAEFDTLLMDMLNYGTAAQQYMDYNLSNLANEAYDKFANYTGCASTDVPTYTNRSKKETLAGDNYKINLSRQLDVSSKILIVAEIRDETTARPRPAYSGDMTNLKAKCEYTTFAGGTDTIWIPVSDLAYNDVTGMYSVAFDKFTTVELDSDVTISIYDGDTLISDTVTYSIASYLEELKGAGYDSSSELYVLAENMTKYCTSALNYFY